MAQTPERWRRIEALYHAALERGREVLDDADPELRREVESLLAEAGTGQGMLDQPVGALLAEAVTMDLEPGARLGPYEIEGVIGQGGMGKVYRARDTRLGRTVAIKTSSARFSERFKREARVIASLNHPNVCTLHDVGPNYLVMEFIDGPTLAERIKRGALPLEEALGIAAQIAGALEAAHAKGVVHRDLKPANIKINAAGIVKVLDFGLAMLEDRALNPEDDTRTVGATLTEAGVVMGTVAYMSPEQARAEKLDARTDLFSFGAVLCEMATGRRAFSKALDWTTPSASPSPRELRRIVLKLLEVDRDLRYQTAADVAADLKRLQRSRESRHARRYWWMAAPAALAMAALAIFYPRPHPAAGRDQWVRLTNFPDSVSQPALSPDGRMLTFVRGPETFRTAGQIYVKLLPDGEPVQLTRDSLDKMSPVFSPDGSRIAYTAGPWDTWVVPVVSGQPRLWLKNASGLVWLDKQRLLFSAYKEGRPGVMGLVTAGETRAGARDVYLPAGERGMAHRSYPSPDGKSSLVVEMDRGNWLPCRLMPLDAAAGALLRGHPVGPPDARCTFAGWSPFGKWMYFSSSAGGGFHIWRQRFPDGRPEQLTSGPSEEEGFALFPDGRTFVTAVGTRQSVVWLHDAAGERQVSLEGYSYDPKITPDGKKLCYRILKGAVMTSDPCELRVVDLDTGHNEPVMPGLGVWGAPQRAYDVSPDGRLVVAAVHDREGKSRLWVASLDGQSPPRQIPDVEGDSPIFGPDGEVFFRQVNPSLAQGYRVRADGTGLRKVSERDIRLPVGLSPDGQWMIAAALAREGAAVFALPVNGGAAADRVLFTRGGSYHLHWSADRRSLFVSAPSGATATRLIGQTYVVPLKPGQLFPSMPEGGFQSAADLAELPGVRIIDAYDAAPGPTPEVYAFARVTVQRNLYKIPIP